MLKKFFISEQRPGTFFRRVDWFAFWTATIVSFLVYFFTLGPSVGLEDSGELATAGDYLGVPHPPGYPIWTICAYFFCRVFSWVTYQGQPTPAWSISLMSAVFGAFAAGFTAMLITRSASDLLSFRAKSADEGGSDWLSCADVNAFAWAGGVAGSLCFAFSPVMWSQATIVEVYTLNAFFLMWIFLLTYRWMRSPSDKTLWLIAFVFGLGLTNYQVLLLAMLPLLIVVFFRNIALFRDFILLGIPVLLTAHMLQIGAMAGAQPGMIGPAFAKHIATSEFAPLVPVSTYVTIALMTIAVVAVSFIGALKCENDFKSAAGRRWLIAAGALALLMFVRISFVPGAQMPVNYTGEPFSWALPTAVLLGAVAVLFALCWTIPRGLFYAIPVAAVQIGVFALLSKGAMNGLTHPTTWWFWWPVIWNFLLLALAWFTLPNGKRVALTAFFMELGVSFYVYMPIVSDLRNPPMNWGYPRTWEGFKHAITRGQYEKISPSDIFSSRMFSQVGFYFTDLRVQFTLIVATLGLLPFADWSFRRNGRSKRINGLDIAASLYVAVSILVLISEFAGGEPLFRLDKWIIGVIFVLLAVGGVTIVFDQLWGFARRTMCEGNQSERLTVGLTLTALGAGTCLFLSSLVLAIFYTDVRGNSLGAMFVALILSILLVAGAIWALCKLRAQLSGKFDFRFDADGLTQQWLIATAAGFFMMSVVLVVLANIRGDLQDSFIQKVKFISSHGLFAIWVGYGMVFGAVIAKRILPKLTGQLFPSSKLSPLLVLALLLAAAIPVYENYNNKWIAFALSGAEQNGHTFGWQFGNYSLRGADAISEELSEEEEPLPNPAFPGEMTTNAVFFGGTDPGRFVPTYMIYSAKVRPDVFLITQNALADNTYMAVERDLYGDDMWIPTPDESAKAFQIYVDEVQSGKRPKNAALTIENGRVQVSGALGVMEINAILTKMMFDKNKRLHDFYVEESYVIPWMYPYLSPHGLIMKINSQPSTLDEKMVNDDFDFWDWYSRRLVRDPMFRRDIPGQKSFSKLRSAIAGLYASRGRFADAEKAFNEARVLYPVSPEANFRLIQEVLIPQNRYEDSLEILRDYTIRDKHNDRGKDFMRMIEEVLEKRQKVSELQAKLAADKMLSFEDTMQLADTYRELGLYDKALKFYRDAAVRPGCTALSRLSIANILSAINKNKEAIEILDMTVPNLPLNLDAKHLWTIVSIYAAGGDIDRATPHLVRYLKLNPRDWRAWIHMAILYASRGQNNETLYAFQRAIEFGKTDAVRYIEGNPSLMAIAEPLFRQLRAVRQRESSVPQIPQPR